VRHVSCERHFGKRFFLVVPLTTNAPSLNSMSAFRGLHEMSADFFLPLATILSTAFTMAVQWRRLQLLHARHHELPLPRRLRRPEIGREGRSGRLWLSPEIRLSAWCLLCHRALSLDGGASDPTRPRDAEEVEAQDRQADPRPGKKSRARGLL